jgi:hypothetical protein
MKMKRIFLVAALTSLLASTVGIGTASADPAASCTISIANVRLADALANIQPKTTSSLVFSWTGSETGCANPIDVRAELRQVGDPSSVEGLINSGLDLNGPTVFDGLNAGHAYILEVTATDGTISASALSAPATTLRGVADSVAFTTGSKAGIRRGFVQIAGVAKDSGYAIAARPVELWIAPMSGGISKKAASSSTDFAGAFNFWIRLTSNSRVIVKVDGASTPARLITVAYYVTARSTAAVAKTKKSAVITASVSPARRVLANLYRANGKKWALVTKAYTTAKGVVKFSVRPTKTTTYRIVVPSDSRNSTAATSLAVRVR